MEGNKDLRVKGVCLSLHSQSRTVDSQSFRVSTPLAKKLGIYPVCVKAEVTYMEDGGYVNQTHKMITIFKTMHVNGY